MFIVRFDCEKYENFLQNKEPEDRGDKVVLVPARPAQMRDRYLDLDDYHGDEAGALNNATSATVFSSVPQAQWAVSDFCSERGTWVKPEWLVIEPAP